jgi:hypothetical protein
MGLERPPARKPVLCGQLELRVGELRVRAGLAQFCEATFRLLAEPIKIGVVGKRHTHLPSLKGRKPFQHPSSAVWARNEGYGRTVEGGLNPLRGRSAALTARGRMLTHKGRWDKQREWNEWNQVVRWP